MDFSDLSKEERTTGGKKNLALCWVFNLLIYPALGGILVLGIGSQILRLPVGLGGAIYGIIFAPVLFGFVSGAYMLLLYFKKYVITSLKHYVTLYFVIPGLGYILFILFTTYLENGELFATGILRKITGG